MTAVIEAPAPRVDLAKRSDTERSAMRQQATLIVEWDRYYEHSRACAECGRRLLNCPTGAELWRAYVAVRGPLSVPVPGARR